MRVIKEKYRESPEFTLFSDFRSAEHTNLFKHREILEEISIFADKNPDWLSQVS